MLSVIYLYNLLSKGDKKMELLEILDEISIGYNNNDGKSSKLKSKINEVRNVLESKGSVLENRNFEFRMDLRNEDSSNSYPSSQIFFQGSYAISTAIKHDSYDVDADLGFYIGEELARGSRSKIYSSLKSALPKYTVTLRNPCIEIDFKDGYKIDVAIYSKFLSLNNKDVVYFHNSIGGTELVSQAKPKVIVDNFKSYLANEPIKRSTIRLMKHFMKNAQKNLRIDDSNKLPSIALMLIASKKFSPQDVSPNEENLNRYLIDLCDLTLDELHYGREISDMYLLISNTLYKITDIKDTIDIVLNVKNNLKSENINSLTSDAVYQKIMNKKQIDTTPSIKGTMG